MRIAEARREIVSKTGISMKQAKKAFDWRLEQGHPIPEAMNLVLDDIKEGIIGGNKPVHYSDPTGGEGVQHAAGEARPEFHYYGWRAPKSNWGK